MMPLQLLPGGRAGTSPASPLGADAEAVRRHLRSVNIHFRDDGGPAVNTSYRADFWRDANTLPGGWWRELAPERRSSIRIDGEYAAEVLYCDDGAGWLRQALDRVPDLTEPQLLLAALVSLIRQGVTAVPLERSLLVAAPQAFAAGELLREVGGEVTGCWLYTSVSFLAPA